MSSPTKTLRLTVERVFDGTPSDVFRGWLQHVWREGGGLGTPTIREQGDVDTGAGEIRRVGGGVVEQIKSGEVGRYVEYSVIAGPFPVRSHAAKVSFEEGSSEGQTQTVVTWSVEVEPYFMCWYLVKRIILWSFNSMLDSMAAKMTRASGTD